MQNLGVDALGLNCGLGPEQMAPLMERFLACSSVPVLAEPNAGLPELVDGKTVFRLPPEPFAEKTAAFVGMGARLVGGCCGTTPDHIAALRRAVDAVGPCPAPADHPYPAGARQPRRAVQDHRRTHQSHGQERSASGIAGRGIRPRHAVRLRAGGPRRADPRRERGRAHGRRGAAPARTRAAPHRKIRRTAFPRLLARGSHCRGPAVLPRFPAGELHQRRSRPHGTSRSAVQAVGRAVHPAAHSGPQAAGEGGGPHRHHREHARQGRHARHPAPPCARGRAGAGRGLQGRSGPRGP